MIEQAIDRSIEDICERIPASATRDLTLVATAIQILCVAKAILTEQRSSNPEQEKRDEAQLRQAESIKEPSNRAAMKNFRNLANL